eukprot:Gb_21836 [translate_table: standard]
MRNTLTYDEWSHVAKMLEKESRKMNECDLYDEELVKNKNVGKSYLREELVRNVGNMCNLKLHKGRLQVPKLIKEYIDEISTQACFRLMNSMARESSWGSLDDEGLIESTSQTGRP